jgi:esterase/lipase
MRRKWIVIIPLLLLVAYFAGPAPSTPSLNTSLPVVPSQPDALDAYVRANESTHKVKPDNEARIIWADSTQKSITDYSIVYLHGFGASQGEGDPVHRNMARRFHCNLYLPRLEGHGLDTIDPFIHFTADKYWQSAKEALAVGKQIGKKVILMGTSTGGSLALLLAADYPEVHSLVLMSPNIQINDPNAWVLNNHWGLQIARSVVNSNYIESKDQRPGYKEYWYTKYRIEGAVQLQELIEETMVESNFRKVKQPVLMLYYYKDKVHQDSVVRVDAMLKMFDQLGTPAGSKFSKAMPETGNHVIGSYVKSADVKGVEEEITRFLTQVIK